MTSKDGANPQKGKMKQQFVYHSQTFENEFRKEAKFLKQLNHPHIVKMVEAKVDDDLLASSMKTQLKISQEGGASGT